jgi:hypothetical protein
MVIVLLSLIARLLVVTANRVNVIPPWNKQPNDGEDEWAPIIHASSADYGERNLAQGVT